ncbi:MAG: hypothetical protein ACTSSH_11250, partial [Candidatus Heimdallarchaeota archaeon]
WSRSKMTKQKQEINKGIGKIVFEKNIAYAKILSPLEGFEEVEQKIEYRKDPLTNHWSRINKLRADRIKQASAPGENFEDNLNQIIAQSAKKCYFCPDNVLKSTPKFSHDLALGERIIIGDFILFPNLFVFSEHHAVGVLGKSHFTKLHKFSDEIWKEAILGSINYFKAVFAKDPTQIYPSINFNFLPPAASSIIHPHIQIMQDAHPTKATQLLIEQSKEYQKAITNEKTSKGNYWLDLIESERNLKERFITENDFMAWLATFSPVGKDELTGIVKIPKTDLTTFTEQECDQLAKEIVTALKALYSGRGVTSVNMAIYLGPINDDISDHYRITIKIVSRPTLMPNYTGDIGFMELLHHEPIGAATPETIAETVKNYFEE